MFADVYLFIWTLGKKGEGRMVGIGECGVGGKGVQKRYIYKLQVLFVPPINAQNLCCINSFGEVVEDDASLWCCYYSEIFSLHI